MNWWQRNKGWVEFVGLTIVWPAAAYGLATWRDYDVDSRPTLATALAISGLIAWVWRNH